MSIELGKSTNKGTALLKLAHQFQNEVILKDNYLSWFFDESVVTALQDNPLNVDCELTNAYEEFQRIAYWYIILREKYGDEVIEIAIESGCKQLLLLGSGYDTRFFRLPSLQKHSIATFEVDLPKTILDKRNCLIEKLNSVPQGLSLVALDFNQDDFENVFQQGFEKGIPSVYIWQGVSYYLPKESISRVLDFIQANMMPNSIFVFDCCSPLMTVKNNQVPGIEDQINKLNAIGEPYLFGLNSDEMEVWLAQKGFQNVEIFQQDELEEKFLHRRTLPNNMWYVVTIRA